MLIRDEFEFALSRPITYHHNGQSEEASLLILKAPSYKQDEERTRIQQGFHRALTGLNSGGESKDKPVATEEVKIGGTDIFAIMLASAVDMVAFKKDFKKLLTSGVCMVEGRESLTSPLYDKIYPEDLDNLMGEYIGNFILSSRLKTLLKI